MLVILFACNKESDIVQNDNIRGNEGVKKAIPRNNRWESWKQLVAALETIIRRHERTYDISENLRDIHEGFKSSLEAWDIKME